jgi:hypothetical protein
MDVEFDKNGMLIYKGVYMGISQEQIFDLQNYVIDVMNYIEEMYSNSIVYIRDHKIELILGE